MKCQSAVRRTHLLMRLQMVTSKFTDKERATATR